jgi:hypothetical protein
MTHDLDFNDAAKLGWEIEPRFEARKGDQVLRGTAAELTTLIAEHEERATLHAEHASMPFIGSDILRSRGLFVSSANRRKSIVGNGTSTAIQTIITRAFLLSTVRRRFANCR